MFYFSIHSGGNQRDLARAKAQKKLQDQAKSKGPTDGLTLEQRRERYLKLWYIVFLNE